MATKPAAKPVNFKKLLECYRVSDGGDFALKDHDPGDHGAGHIDHSQADQLLAQGVTRLAELQNHLYAQDRWTVLAVFQAMDAAGKDGTISHVLTGVNPQGVHAISFKQPSTEELAHGFLWRINRAMPPRGHIGIFNRSHYEDVLITRVHPELIDLEKLPAAARGGKFWKHRLSDIKNFETYAARQGIVILKFFLHLSKEEQKNRLLERIDEPSKNWKFSINDLREREHWQAYQHAYEEAIRATATKYAPGYIVPADNKWYTRLIVVAAMIDALENLDLTPPCPSPALTAELQRAKAALQEEK